MGVLIFLRKINSGFVVSVYTISENAIASGEESLQRFHAGFDLWDGDGVAEAQMPLTLSTEDRAGDGRDVRFLEKQFGGGAAVLVNLFDIRKRVESASRR